MPLSRRWAATASSVPRIRPGGHRVEHELEAVPQALAELVAAEHVLVLVEPDLVVGRPAPHRLVGAPAEQPGERQVEERRRTRRATAAGTRRRRPTSLALYLPRRERLGASSTGASSLGSAMESVTLISRSGRWCSGRRGGRRRGRPRGAGRCPASLADMPDLADHQRCCRPPTPRSGTRGRATRRPGPRRRASPRPTPAGARAGRPTVTAVPAAGAAAGRPGSGSVPPSTSTWPPSAEIVPGKQFMGGVPMNWATNVLIGRAYTSCGRAHLLELAHRHDRHPGGHGHGLDLVVGDVDDGGADPLVELDELDAGLGPELGVEVRQRLVHQEHLGPARRTPGPGRRAGAGRRRGPPACA